MAASGAYAASPLDGWRNRLAVRLANAALRAVGTKHLNRTIKQAFADGYLWRGHLRRRDLGLIECVEYRPRAGDRVEDGGRMGTLVRCPECSGDGLLHDPDERPPATPPSGDS